MSGRDPPPGWVPQAGEPSQLFGTDRNAATLQRQADMRNALAHQPALVGELLAILKRVEWKGTSNASGDPGCPVCDGEAPLLGAPGVHRDGCELAALIKKAEGTP